jgi:O-antigen ligase/polysaccharide polymerase Wzy-like membrane protein
VAASGIAAAPILVQLIRCYNPSFPVSTQAPSRALPDPTPVLFALALAVVWAIWFLDKGPWQVIVLLAALAPVVLALGAWLGARAYLTMVLLIVASAMPRIFVEVGSSNIRPEHLTAGLAILALPWLWNARERRIEWLRADWLLAGYILANLVSSWFMSPDAGQTMKAALQQCLAIAPYYFLRIVAGGEQSFRRAFRVVLVVGALEAAYAVIAVYGSLWFGTVFALELEQYEDVAGVYGTQYEPNLLGSYCGACAVMMLVMYLKERKRAYLIGYMLTFAGMAVSFSRGALLATSIALAAVVLLSWQRRWLGGRVFFRMAGATVLMVALLGPILIPGYISRFSTVAGGDPTADPNTMFRVAQNMMGLEQFVASPILGTGTLSFALQFDWDTAGLSELGWEEKGWLSNTGGRILHDTGLVGFTLFCAMLGSLFVGARRVLQRDEHPELLALVLASLVYMISFQFTEGTLLAFSWVHLGLLGCAVALWRRPRDTGQEPALATGRV